MIDAQQILSVRSRDFPQMYGLLQDWLQTSYQNHIHVVCGGKRGGGGDRVLIDYNVVMRYALYNNYCT